MATNIVAEFAGQSGVNPRLVRVTTTDSEAEIKTAGWLNQFEQAASVKIFKTDFIFVSWTEAGVAQSGLFLPEFSATGEITLVSIAGDGGGSFPDQENTFFVSKAGDDVNSGKSPGDAKLTITSALAEITDLAARNVIYILDSGTYVENVVAPANSNVIIQGRNATIEVVSGPVTTGAGGTLTLDMYSIVSGTAAITAVNNNLVIAYTVEVTGTVQSGSGGDLFLDTEIITGAVVADGEMHLQIDDMTGNLLKTSATVVELHANIQLLTGNISLNSSQSTLEIGELTGTLTLTETVPGDSFFTANITRIGGAYSLTSSISNNPRGFIGNIIYGTYDIQNEWLSSNNSSMRGLALSAVPLNVNYTFQSGDSGRAVILTSSSNIQLTAPDVATVPGLPVGWSCLVIQSAAGSGKINVMGADRLESVSGREWTEGRGAVSRLTLVAESGGIRTWSWGGQISGSGLAEDSNVYVSQLDGDDATANGSESQPFATIQAAVDFAEAAGAPANPVAVVVMDGETYTETVTISQPNIALLAPLATLTQAGANNVLVITTLSPNPFFANVGIIRQQSTGLCISHTGTSPTVIKAASIIGPNTTFPTIDFGDADGTLIVDAVILGRITVNNGDVTYRATTRTRQSAILGTGSIKGIALTGVDAEKWSMTNAAEVVGDFEIWDSNWSKQFLIQKNSAGTGWQMTIADDPQEADVTMYLPSFPTDWRVLGTSVVPDLGANIITVDVTVSQADLAAAASKVLYASDGTKQYKIREMYANSNGTNFSGGGGDRLATISDGTTDYSVIPAADLQTLTNNRWGSAKLPFPASAAINTSTAAGADLTIAYSGGTTDYTAGSVVITVVLERVA